MKKLFGIGLAISVLILNIGTVFAEEAERNDVTYSEINYNTEEISTKKYEITSLIASKNEITIEQTGESAFVDIIATLVDGSKICVSDCADWSSSNDEIVFADRGRILALGAGTVTIEVFYGGYSQNIMVTVIQERDIASIVNELNGGISLYSSSVDIAKGMVEYQWKPTSNVRGWRNEKTFNANTTYTGIPYSQTAYQVDKDEFVNAMKKADFYSDYTRTLSGENIIMPKYGNDCSGFVSFAWEISRKTTSGFITGIKDGTFSKVGTYDSSNPTTTDLKAAYKKLIAGDAVVKSGHAFLIASNDIENSKVYVYEQTPYMARYTSWTYDSLAAAKYMPFRK